MKKEKIFLFVVLVAAWVAFNAAPAWAQEKPEKGTKDKSVEGTKDKSVGGAPGTLPRDPDTQTPLGGSESKQTTEKPLKKPPADTSPSEKGTGPSGTKEEKSLGPQSQRTGPDSPMGKEPAGRAERKGAEGMEARGGRSGETLDKEHVKMAQEALKNKGHDPGPIDGVVGPKTREAVKQFQSASGLKETGRLDAQTAQKLGVDKGGAPKEARESKEPAGKEPSAKGKAESSSIPREPPASGGKPESSPMPKEPAPAGK